MEHLEITQKEYKHHVSKEEEERVVTYYEIYNTKMGTKCTASNMPREDGKTLAQEVIEAYEEIIKSGEYKYYNVLVNTHIEELIGFHTQKGKLVYKLLLNLSKHLFPKTKYTTRSMYVRYMKDVARRACCNSLVYNIVEKEGVSCEELIYNEIRKDLSDKSIKITPTIALKIKDGEIVALKEHLEKEEKKRSKIVIE